MKPAAPVTTTLMGSSNLSTSFWEGEQRRLPGRRPGRLCRRRDERKPAGFLSCFDHFEAHRTRRALDHLHGCFGVVRVEVLALRVDDLAYLRPRDPSDLLAVWLR